MDPTGNGARTDLNASSSERRSAARVEAAYFDGLVSQEGEFNPFADSGWATIRRRFEEFVAPRPGLAILDIGCGTGQSRRLYVDWAAEYTGVDLSEIALERARKKYPSDRWQCCDARELPWESGTFDLVAYSSVLHHIPDFDVALAEGLRVLKPGGHAFAFDPNLLHPAMALIRHPKSPLYSSNGVSPNEAPVLPSRLRRGFSSAGFVEVRQRAQSDIAYREVAPRLLNACLKLYNLADHWYERIGLGKTFGTFVITCGRKRQ